MKVILVNGSPHKNGCTNRALEEVAGALGEDGVATEIFWLGRKPVGGCVACGGCTEKGACVFGDIVNDFAEKAAGANGFVFGAPVHYSHACASLLGFMDRLFYSARHATEPLPNGAPDVLAFKPAAAVTCARRAGNTSAFDDISKYFTIAQMPIVSSRYWNNSFGWKADDVEQDGEGLRTMRQLGHNMAWMLKCIEAGRAAGIELPAQVPGSNTDFIR